MIKANDPALRSWVSDANKGDFPIQNLPFGVFSVGDARPRLGVAIGSKVLDLQVLHTHGLLAELNIEQGVFASQSINELLQLGKPVWRALRQRISDLLNADNDQLRDNSSIRGEALHEQSAVTMHMPVRVGDYTDFYSSREHATNVGTMFRDPANALLPNWLHLPVGYHGRASSIVVSGTPVRRPCGQTKADDAAAPGFGPSRLLDFELEMAFITGDGKPLGERISTAEADDHIFGMVLFNDWSARDIQKWEYVPLGPFLAKSFASSISPWIVTLDALEPFRTAGPEPELPILPYLQTEGDKAIDINLEVFIQPEGGAEHRVCRSNFRHMYWSIEQQLAHHTVNGCNLRSGDMCASGTISGPTPDSYGSMLELAWKGSKPLQMPDGSERKFILDGDTVIMRGWSEKDGVRVGFGEVRGKVLPASL